MKEIEFNQTVLVIGAGAHVPYGLPTSKSLTKQIKALFSDARKVIMLEPGRSDDEALQDKKAICRLLRDLKVVPPPKAPTASNSFDIALGGALDGFVKSFGESQVYSVDAYLAEYLADAKNDEATTRSQIGKLLISYFVAKHEAATPIGFHEFDWIQYIINVFLKEKKLAKKFFEAPPAIFTFNYDNLLEKSIYSHLVHFHRENPEIAKAKVDSLGINHIYGHIGTFGSCLDVKGHELHSRALREMKVIGEERTAERFSSVADAFRAKVEKSNAIYFLGFSFDPINAGLLFSKFDKSFSEDCNEHVRISSTNIGLGPLDISQIRRHVPVKVNFFVGNQTDCLNLISERAPIFIPKPPNPIGSIPLRR